MSSVSIKKGPLQLAGLLYKSAKDPDSKSKSPGPVIVHPGGSVKEQKASLYAMQLAQEDFVTVLRCFTPGRKWWRPSFFRGSGTAGVRCLERG